MKRILILLPLLAVVIAGSVSLFTLTQTNAVQDPRISLDMDGSGNTYAPTVDLDFNGIPDAASNIMTVGTVQDCLTHAAPGDAAQHLHGAPAAGDPPVQLVIQNVEDASGYQARINFDGTKIAITAAGQVNHTPFTDGTTPINFLNLPVDATGSHKTVFGSQDILDPATANGTILLGSSALALDNAGQAPDTPSKGTHDETTLPGPETRSYEANGGGVLAQVQYVVRAGQVGQATLPLDLDDNSPNTPGSKVDIFTGVGTLQSILLSPASLGDGFHGEGTACVPLAQETPTPTPLFTPTPAPGQPTPTPAPGQATPTPAPGAGGRTPTRTPVASPAALPPTGSDGDTGSPGFVYVILFGAALAIPASAAGFGILRLRRR